MISTLRTASGRAPLARISNSIGARGRGIVPANGNLDSIRRNVTPFSSMSYLIAEHETGRFREAAARPFVLAANAIDMGFSGTIIDSSESPSDSPQSVQTVAFRDLQGCGAVDDDGG